MKIERRKNTKRNIVWGGINKVLTILLPFLIRTIILRILGNEYVGLNSLFNSILQVLNLAELGFGSAIVFSMYRPIATDDDVTICALLNYYKKVYTFIGTIVFVCGICLLPFLRLFINGSCPSDVNIYILYVIYLLNTSCSYFLYAYKTSLFYAFQRNDILLKINTLTMAIQYFLQVLMLVVFKNYYTYIIILPLATIVTNLANAYAAKKYYPEYTGKGILNQQEKKEIKTNVSALICHKIGGVVVGSIDSIVVSSFLGLTVLSWYGNYYYILSALVGIITIIYNSMTAGIGNSVVEESVEKNYDDYLAIKRLMSKLIAWCSICLLCLYQPFMKLWVGKQNLLNEPYVWVFSFYFYIHMIRKINITYRDALGYWKETMWQPIISAVVNLTINIILVQKIGLYGVLISTIVCMIFIDMPWEVNVLYKKYFKRTQLTYYRDFILEILEMLIIASFTFYITKNITFNGVSGFLVNLVVSGILALFYYVVISLFEKDRKQQYRLISGIIRKK